MSPLGVILFRPVLPVALVVIIVVAVGAGAWYTYVRCPVSRRQRLCLWGCRMSAILIIAWLLLQAERRKVHHDQEPPVLAIALDVSASMAEQLPQADDTRSGRAVEFLRDAKIGRLCRRYRLFRYEVGADLEERTAAGAELRFNAPRSYISSGINQIANRLRADNVAGIILISDGLDHSGDDLTPQALAVPVFVPELEEPFDLHEEAEADCWIAELSYPQMMVVNWKANVDVLVRRRGQGELSMPVHLRLGERNLRSSMVEFGVDEQFKQVSFNIEPTDVGQLLYRVEITPKQDSDPDNNAKDFLIEVTDPKNRVLYLEGAPRWEFKFLKRALLAERNYQLSAFVRGGDGSFINFSEISGMSGGDLPKFNEEELAGYKVIVLGDMPASALTENDCRGVRDFVDKGGGLLLLGASRAYGKQGLHTAPYLKELLPAAPENGSRMNEGRFSVDLTSTGRTHPAVTGLPHETRLPPILSFWAPVEASEFSSTLIATADGSPVLVVRRYGQGRVAMVFSDSLWRWQLGGMDDSAEKSLYSGFVTQLTYWLAPSEKDLEKTGILQALIARSEVELRERVVIGGVLEAANEGTNETLTCNIRTPDDQHLLFPMVPASLGTDVGLTRPVDGYRCVFTPQLPGKYQVTVSTPDGTQQTTLLMLAAEPEYEKTGAAINREYLEKITQDTGGLLVQWKDRYRMFDDIPFAPKEVQIVEEYPIWNRWWWLAVLIFVFCLEWWWRRRLDMV